MGKLPDVEQAALTQLLESGTTAQCFEVMKQALNAFTIHACKGEPEPVKAQYGTMIHPLMRDMVMLEAFHELYLQQQERRMEVEPDAE